MSRFNDIDLNSLPIFLALVEAGSFTAAAERLGSTKTRVSLKIRQLEERLGQALFHRTTRRVQLTQAGEVFYRECGSLMEGVQNALTAVEGDHHALYGELRISAPEDYASQVLGAAIAAFGQRHPTLHIELRSGDQISDMLKEGIDIAFRLGWLKDSSLRARRLGAFQQYLLASPDYLARHGTPNHPEQLPEHAWIAFTPLSSPLTWEFGAGKQRYQVQVRAQLAANSTAGLSAMLEAGAGMSVLPDFTAEAAIKSGRLVRLLPEWSLPVGHVHAVYPPGRYTPPRVRSFMAFFQVWIAGES